MFVTIVLQASAVVRHTFYEAFLHFHILLVIAAIVALWIHLEAAGVPDQLFYLKTVIGAWAGEVRILIPLSPKLC